MRCNFVKKIVDNHLQLHKKHQRNPKTSVQLSLGTFNLHLMFLVDVSSNNNNDNNNNNNNNNNIRFLSHIYHNYELKKYVQMCLTSKYIVDH